MFEKLKQRFQKKTKPMKEAEEEEIYENTYTDYTHMLRCMYYNPIIFSPYTRAEAYIIAVEHDIRILGRELEPLSVLNTKDSFVYWCDHYETICNILDRLIALRGELRHDLHLLPEVENWLNNGREGWIPIEANIFVPILAKFPSLLVKFKEAIRISEISYQLLYHSMEDAKTIRDDYLATARILFQVFNEIPEPDYGTPDDPTLWTDNEIQRMKQINTRAREIAQSSN